jgi:hypothetical protein
MFRKKRTILPTYLKPIILITLIALIMLSVKYIEQGTVVLQELIYSLFSNQIKNSTDTFALGWIVTYFMGTPISVVQLGQSFFSNEIITNHNFATFIIGTRIGSTGIVLILGILYYKMREKKNNIFAFIFSTYMIYIIMSVLTLLFYNEIIQITYLQEIASILNNYGKELLGNSPTIGQASTDISEASLSPVLSFILGVTLMMGSFYLLDKIYIHSKDINPKNPLFKKFINHVQKPFSSFFLGALLSIACLSNLSAIVVSLPVFIHYKYKKHFGIDFNHYKVYYNMLFPYLIGTFLGGLSDSYFIARVTDDNTMLSICLALIISALITSIILILISAYLFPHVKKIAEYFEKHSTLRAWVIFIITILPFLLFFS